jgi:hypothetical protein
VPTIFEQLDGALAGGNVSVNVSVQIDNLGSISASLSNLTATPPDAVGALSAALAELAGPDFEVAGGLAATLDDLEAALPADLTAVLRDVFALIGDLEAAIASGLAGVVGGVLQVVDALEALTEIDFRCLGPAEVPPGGGDGDGGNGGDNGSGGNGGGSATATATAAATERVNTTLDLLPDPLTVESLLRFANTLLDGPERDTLFPRVMPFFDDIRDPLQTLVRWGDLTGEEIRADFAATLGGAAGLAEDAVADSIVATGADAAAAAGAIPLVQLGQIADGLSARLDELGDAVRAGDLSGTEPAIDAVNILLDQYETLQDSLAGGPLAAVDDVRARLAALPLDLQDRVTLVVYALDGTSGPGLVGDLADLLAGESPDASIAAFGAQLSSYAGWLQDLLAKLDLSALEGPVAAAAGGARELVDSVDDALLAVTMNVQELFGQLESIVAGLDLDGVVAELESTLEGFTDDLVEQLSGLFETARDAVAEVVEAIDGAVDAFDPAEIVGVLQEAIDAIASVLEGPAVLGTVEQIGAAIEGASVAVEAVSFQPLVDEVVAAIDEVTEALGQIDTESLGMPAQLALQGALAILPENLTPVTDPLVADFGVLVDEGPIPLLAAVEAQPQRLLDQVRGFEPGTLVGDALSGPYQELLADMEAVAPSALLAPVEAELDALKARLLKQARPGLALEPLQPAYDALLEAFDRFQPGEVVAQLTAPVTAATTSAMQALPLDEAFGQLDVVLAKVEDALELLQAVTGALERIRDVAGAFTDPAGELAAWIDSILGKVEPLPDDGTLAAALASLVDALDALRAESLAGACAAAVDPVLAELDELDPQGRLFDIVRGHSGVPRAQLDALPDSPAKSALAAALDRFDPMEPAFGDVYRSLASWRTALEQAKTDLDGMLQGWDERYHGDGRPLTTFADVEPEPAQLAERVRAHLEDRFAKPLTMLFGFLEPLHDGIEAALAPALALSTDMEGKLGAVLTGPGSLGAIRGELQTLVDRIGDLNLDFLAESLDGVFAEIRGQLTAADPSALAAVLDRMFADVVGTIGLDAIVPPAELEALDATYTEVLAKLRELDPGVLVTEVVQPAFDEKIDPLLAAFDLTPLLGALIVRLEALEEELRAELDRVNEAWKRLRGAIPSISIGVDIDIGIDVGSPF